MSSASLAGKVASFSSCYEVQVWKNLYFIDPQLLESKNPFEEIRSDPLKAMKFFTMYAHERAGRSLNYPKYHRIALEKALQGRSFEEALNLTTYPKDVWREFENLCNQAGEGTNKSRTQGPVKKILEELRKSRSANIIELLGGMRVREARSFLRNIKGIGDKVSALIMRDFHVFFNLWEDELNKARNRGDAEPFVHLQPVDRWVERIAEAIWNIKLTGSHDDKAKNIVKNCLSGGVDPARFNQGAWFIGSHLEQLCVLHGIPEEERLHDLSTLRKTISKLDPKKTEQAMQEALELLKERKIMFF